MTTPDKTVSRRRVSGTEDPDTLVSLTRRISLLEGDLAGLRRAVQQMDYDLQDAVDGFYRRRQSDRMRDVREDIQRQKPPTMKDVMNRALLKAVQNSGSDSKDKEEPTE